MDLNFKTFGQGDPVLILHGLFGMLDNWQTIARQLAKNYTVFIVDQRNHGRSPHTDIHDYPSMAEDLRVFMEDQFVLKAHLIGHSMGGKTAMQLALHYPDMIDKLVVVDIAPKTYPSGHHEIFQALFDLDLKEVQSRKEIDQQLSAFIKEPGVRQFLMKNVARDPDLGFRLKMNLPVIFQGYDQILQVPEMEEPFHGESLFIKGGDSRYIDAEDLPLIQEFFPEARLETIPGAGHWVHADQPQMLLKSIQDFLEV